AVNVYDVYLAFAGRLCLCGCRTARVVPGACSERDSAGRKLSFLRGLGLAFSRTSMADDNRGIFGWSSCFTCTARRTALPVFGYPVQSPHPGDIQIRRILY